MWLCTKLGFYSIVLKAPDEVHVRARFKKDLDNLRAAVIRDIDKSARRWKVIRTEPADYRYRMIVSTVSLQAIMQVLAMSLDYSNFKGVISVTQDQRDKMDAYFTFHHDMERLQLANEISGQKHKGKARVTTFRMIETQDDDRIDARSLRGLVPGIEDATD